MLQIYNFFLFKKFFSQKIFTSPKKLQLYNRHWQKNCYICTETKTKLMMDFFVNKYTKSSANFTGGG